MSTIKTKIQTTMQGNVGTDRQEAGQRRHGRRRRLTRRREKINRGTGEERTKQHDRFPRHASEVVDDGLNSCVSTTARPIGIRSARGGQYLNSQALLMSPGRRILSEMASRRYHMAPP